MTALSHANRVAYVIGNPIEHSLSPVLHRYWLDHYGIREGYYQALAVSKKDLATVLRDFWLNERVMGCNITIPHKRAVATLCTTLTPRAKRMNAVNTLMRTKEGWLGDSSDGWAFVRSLEQELMGKKSTQIFDHVLIIGAGGAAASIADALLDEDKIGKRLVILNRSQEKAEQFSNQIRQQWGNLHNIIVEPREYTKKIIDRDIDLLIQTTPMGMEGGPEFDIEFEELKKECLVADIVYRPLVTECLFKAQVLGNPTMDGLGMLLYQGVIGFKSWFGIEPRVDDHLRQVLIESMSKKNNR